MSRELYHPGRTHAAKRRLRRKIGQGFALVFIVLAAAFTYTEVANIQQGIKRTTFSQGADDLEYQVKRVEQRLHGVD